MGHSQNSLPGTLIPVLRPRNLRARPRRCPRCTPGSLRTPRSSVPGSSVWQPRLGCANHAHPGGRGRSESRVHVARGGEGYLMCSIVTRRQSPEDNTPSKRSHDNFVNLPGLSLSDGAAKKALRQERAPRQRHARQRPSDVTWLPRRQPSVKTAPFLNQNPRAGPRLV